MDDSSNVVLLMAQMPPATMDSFQVLNQDESTESLTIKDSLKIKGSANNIVLPASAVEGLKPFQVAAMKMTVHTVRNNSRIAGELVRSTASTLHEMKQNLVNKQWIKFLKSGALPIPEKQARDLVAAWEGWLGDSDVTDGDLVGVGTRTLAKMKNLGPADRKKVVKKLKAGEKVTEKDVTPKQEVNARESKDERTTKKDLLESVETLQKLVTEKGRENYALKQRIEELEKELEFAKAG